MLTATNDRARVHPASLIRSRGRFPRKLRGPMEQHRLNIVTKTYMGGHLFRRKALPRTGEKRLFA